MSKFWGTPPPLPDHNHLKEVRERAGMGYLALAEAVDVTISHIRDIEAGVAAPSLVLALLIAEALETRVDYLFCVDEHEREAVDGDEMERLRGFLVTRVPIGAKQPVWSEQGGVTRALLERKPGAPGEVLLRFDDRPESWVVYPAAHWMYVYPPQPS